VYFTGTQDPDGSCTVTGVAPTPSTLTTTLSCDGRTSQGNSWTYGEIPGDPSLGTQVQFVLDGSLITCDPS
jgi:hypothetical protein